VALGVGVAVVFASKTPLHLFVRGVLTDSEVNDGLVFAVVSVVIWPFPAFQVGHIHPGSTPRA
jgi:uncharacterized membrane protein (DUF4010 family)